MIGSTNNPLLAQTEQQIGANIKPQMRQAAAFEAGTRRHCGAAGAKTVVTSALTAKTMIEDCADA